MSLDDWFVLIMFGVNIILATAILVMNGYHIYFVKRYHVANGGNGSYYKYFSKAIAGLFWIIVCVLTVKSAISGEYRIYTSYLSDLDHSGESLLLTSILISTLYDIYGWWGTKK